MNSTAAAFSLSSERLGRIQPVMQAYVDQGKLAGLISAVAHRGEIVHFETYGHMDLEANKPMQDDAIFRIASMTKPIATVAGMMLYEEGHFQLADPVSKFIPAFRDLKVNDNGANDHGALVDLQREITMRDLMTHTSGLIYNHDYDKTLEENVQELVRIPLGHQPGAMWQYSESLSVLAYIIEMLSETTFDRFLKERILDPLGMSDTAYHVPEEKIARLTAVYGPAEEGGLALIEPPQTSPYVTPRPFFSGSSGLVSTAPDYLRFAQMLLNGGQFNGERILGPKTVAFMLQNHVPEQLLPLMIGDWELAGFGFGLGGYVVLDTAESQVLGSIGNFGWGGSYTTKFWIDPQEEIAGVVMAQFEPSGIYPLIQQLSVLTYQALVD